MITVLALMLAGVAPPPPPAPAVDHGLPAPLLGIADDAARSRATVEGELVAGGSARFSEGAEPGLAFVLERAELGATFRSPPGFEAALTLEAVRSAGAQSAFGIDGNSLLPRFKHAWAGLDLSFSVLDVPLSATLQVGLVSEPWLLRLEPFLGTRALGPLASDDAGLLDPSDLGVNGGLSLAGGLVAVDLSVRNGEGKREIELNADKDVVAVVSTGHELRLLEDRLDLAAMVMARHGTRGISSAPEERVALGAGVRHARFHSGGELQWARGDEGDAGRDRVLAALFGDVTLLPRWLGVAGRGALDLTEAKLPETAIVAGSLAFFTELGHDGQGALPRIRVLGGAAGRWAEPGAALAGMPAAASELRLFLFLEAAARAEALAP